MLTKGIRALYATRLISRILRVVSYKYRKDVSAYIRNSRKSRDSTPCHLDCVPTCAFTPQIYRDPAIVILGQLRCHKCSVTYPPPPLQTMHFYLSNHHQVINTNFCNVEGQVLYTSETPGFIQAVVFNKKTTISKVIPNNCRDDMGVLL